MPILTLTHVLDEDDSPEHNHGLYLWIPSKKNKARACDFTETEEELAMKISQCCISVCAIFVLLSGTVSAQQKRAGPESLYPDPAKTPGATNPDIRQDNIAKNICSKSWSTDEVRPSNSYTARLNQQQMSDLALHGTTADYEEDHLISLENGGCPKCPENLWPQPYGDLHHHMTQSQRSAWDKSHPSSQKVLPGALQKDKVESFIHDEICHAVPNARLNSSRQNPATISITLHRGQEILSTDWYMCYLKMMHHMPCR